MSEDKSKTPSNPSAPTNPPTPTNEPKESESEKAARALEGRVREAIKPLKFRTNKKIEEEGQPTQYVRDERPMRMTDVLSAAVVNGTLVIVTADGRKHRLAA
jgi:hypothetical protein